MLDYRLSIDDRAVIMRVLRNMSYSYDEIKVHNMLPLPSKPGTGILFLPMRDGRFRLFVDLYQYEHLIELDNVSREPYYNGVVDTVCQDVERTLKSLYAIHEGLVRAGCASPAVGSYELSVDGMDRPISIDLYHKIEDGRGRYGVGVCINTRDYYIEGGVSCVGEIFRSITSCLPSMGLALRVNRAVIDEMVRCDSEAAHLLVESGDIPF